VKRTWVTEFYEHSHPGVFQPIIIEGSADEKRNQLTDLARVATNIGAIPVPIINYDVLSQSSQKTVLKELIRMAEAGLFGKLILDEASMIKNPMSGRGKEAFRLSKRIPVLVAMTGTPYPKKLTDIFNIMRCLSPEILGVSWPAFKRHHVVLGGYLNKEIIGYKNEDELEERVSCHSIRHLLRDCVDLPEEIHVNRYCNMSTKQIQITRELQKQMMAELEDEQGNAWILSVTNALTRLLRFNQITSGFLETEDGTTVFSPNPKLDLLMSIIQDEVPEDQKGVIWCAYQRDVEKIVRSLRAARFGAVSFYGRDSSAQKAENERVFKEDPEVRFMVATPDAGGYGLNWQMACWCIFYSYTFRWEALDQAKARIRRLTQQQKMMYLWLVAENPQTKLSTHGVASGVNQYILDNLTETSKMAQFMTGDFRRTGIDPKALFKRAIEVM
jgi:SNF2 family DNA or RNA helicase